MADSILPPALRTGRWRVLEQLLDRQLGFAGQVLLLVDAIDASVLPWLADFMSLFGDGWELTQTEAGHRELIRAAIEIHRHKGTPWAIKRTLALIGYGDAVLVERDGYHEYDGQIDHDATAWYEQTTSWTHYRLIMTQPVTLLRAAQIRSLLADIAPLRCLLVALQYSLHYDATSTYDGQYGHGTS